MNAGDDAVRLASFVRCAEERDELGGRHIGEALTGALVLRDRVKALAPNVIDHEKAEALNRFTQKP